MLFEKLKWLIICLAPFWLWLAMYFLIAPDTALARFLVVGLGLYCLGVIQVLCLLFYAVGILPTLKEQQKKQRRLVSPS